MDPQPDSPASRLPGSGALGDLPTRGADWVDTVVELLRDKTVRPVTLVARVVVFGIIIFAAAVTTVVLLSITLIRLLTVYAFDGRVWLSDLVVGVLFVIIGIVAWSQRTDSRGGGRGCIVTESRQLIIVGSGPAGLTAAIYAARAQLSPLVIEGEPSSTSDQPGGQLMLTTEVENFPGFVNGIMGPELMQAFREQAARFGADYVTAKASKVDLSHRPFGVWVGDPDAAEPTYEAESLIISTGAQSLMLNLPNEERLLGYGVSTSATCDGFFFRERNIAVVGGGDSALEEALFLTRFADKVTVIHRRGELRASKVMQQRAFAHEKIEFLWNTSVIDVLGENTVSGIRVRDNLSEEESVLDLSGLFVAIGHQPNTSLFKGQLEMEENGYLRTFDGTRTNVDGVFVCGDVQDHRYRQAITAAGSGCMAALDVERWLEDQHSGGRLTHLAVHSPATGPTGEYPGLDGVDVACPTEGHQAGPEQDGQEETAIMSDQITTLNDASFDEHVKSSDVPVLVDFWAEWCGPCKMIAPVLEEIATEQAGKLEVAKLNIDDNLDITRRFDVMSIPTLILFKDGEPAARIVGAKGKGQLLQELSAHL